MWSCSGYLLPHRKTLVPVIMSMGGILGAMAWMLHKTVEERGLEGLRGYHVPGISYVVNENNPDMESVLSCESSYPASAFEEIRQVPDALLPNRPLCRLVM